MDQSRWSACVITPFRPRRRMNASDTRNGGEISGRRLMSETKRLPGMSERVTEYASTSATATVMAVETADTTRLLTRMRRSRDEVGSLERRVHDPRMNDVAPDPVLCELDRQRLGQRDERALGGGVRVLGACEADERRDRAHQDHRATAGAPELRDPVLRHPEGGLEVDGDHAVPRRLVRLQHRAIAVFPEHAGVVIEDVEPAEVARAVLDHATDVPLDRDVSTRGESSPAAPLDKGDGLSRGLLVDVGDDDTRTLLG